MEKIYKRVPFDIELAKDIQSGKIEGKIVTINGDPIRVLAFDIKDKFPIVVVVTRSNGNEFVYTCESTGKYIEGYSIPVYDLAIELSEETSERNYVVGDIVYIPENDDKTVYVITKIVAREAHLKNPVTEEIIQIPLLAIQHYDEYVKSKVKHKFKPFDKVLVREYDEAKWTCDIFSDYDDYNKRFRCLGGDWLYCIPFEGNEHLVGTSNNPE